MNKTKILSVLLSVILISACESEPSTDLQDSIVEVTPETAGSVNPTALFDPSNSVIPFPNNLLFSGSTDLTLNLPGTDPASLAYSALDGFSTVAPLAAGFSTAIDASSISGASVKVYEVTLCSTDPCPPIGGPVVNIDSTLTFGEDFDVILSPVDSANSTLSIRPLKPLDPLTSYMVVITDDLKAANGSPFAPSITYQLIKSISTPLDFDDPSTLPGIFLVPGTTRETVESFESLRSLINTGEATVAAGTSLQTTDIIQSWSFTTQSVGVVLQTVRGLVGTPTTSVSASTVDLGSGAGLSIAGAASVYEGTIDVPYYLTAPSESNPTALLTESWQADAVFPPSPPGAGSTNLTALNSTPAVTNSALSVPLLITTPVGGAGPPWDAVIFQHGVTRNRTDMLLVADKLASVGLATIAIDIPLHGVRETNDFYQMGNERTFDVDFVTQDANGSIIAAATDGTIDFNGAHYINLQNLVVQRDNVRQAVADLFSLTTAIPTIDIPDVGTTADFTSEIYFVGNSLGGMIGTVFTALESNVKDVVLVAGSGSIPKLLDGSASFGPVIAGGLAAAGVNKGTADYEAFLGAAQAAVDSADPINYAVAATSREGILYFQVVGGDPNPLPPSDLTIPIRVPDNNDTSNTVAAPLAGSDPLVNLMELEQSNSAQSGGTDLQTVYKFVVGKHSSLIDPSADAFNDLATNTAVYTEMQNMMAEFLASDGADVPVLDATLLQTPTP
jgi:pimeloyl-ACP methyl ester carboxylesterase